MFYKSRESSYDLIPNKTENPSSPYPHYCILLLYYKSEHTRRDSHKPIYPREVAKLRGYTSCSVVAVAVTGLLVLYLMKQVENLPLQQGIHARMQFGILPLQQGNSRSVHAVWYPATAVWYPATAVWYPATAVWYPATAV
jgi:hypothetical protein